MHFPKHLYHGYQSIKNCALVRNKSYTQETLKEFETMLNSSQPRDDCMEKFITVKDFYNANKFGFQKFIKGSPLECTILWTESKSIVNWFHLRGIVYLSYDHKNNRYRVQLHRNLENGEQPADGEQRYGERVDLGVGNLPNVKVLRRRPAGGFEESAAFFGETKPKTTETVSEPKDEDEIPIAE
jgi:hypothetical protein